MYWVFDPEKCVCFVYKVVFMGLKHPNKISIDFENKITDAGAVGD